MPERSGSTGDLDDVDLDCDLDVPPADPGAPPPPPAAGGGRGRAGGRARSLLRNRWVLPVTVAVLVLLLAAAGVRQARVAATADLERARSLAAVDVGTLQVLYDAVGDGSQPLGDGGRVRVRARAPVVNTGEGSVAVTVVGTSTAAAVLTGPADTQQLRAGASGVLDLTLDVDCAAVPVVAGVDGVPSDGGSDGAGEWLRLRVEVDGRSTEQRYLTADAPWTGLDAQLPYLCDPWYASASVATSVRADGRLVVDVTNPSSRSTALSLETTPVLGASADVATPVVVPGRGRVELVVSLAPDCSRISTQSAVDPSSLPFAVSRVVEPGQVQDITDTTVTAAWVARQVALACG